MSVAKSFPILLTGFLLHTWVHAADKIRISIPNLSGQFMTMSVAQKRGFLKEEGIEAEIIRVTGGAADAAMSGGELDYTTGMSLSGAITGAYPVKAVACFVPAPVLSMVARPEIKTVPELKGKTVGVSLTKHLCRPSSLRPGVSQHRQCMPLVGNAKIEVFTQSHAAPYRFAGRSR